MHRRECFERAGGWDEQAPMRYGDAYFWNRLIASGYQFHHIPEVLDVHRFHKRSLTWKIDHPEEDEDAKEQKETYQVLKDAGICP
jgi:GT2 family glycosyltransferase